MSGKVASIIRGGCLAATAVVLAGCGGGGDGGGKGPSSETTTTTQKGAQTTVLMMRHCARSIPEKDVWSDPKYQSFNDYSKQVWPPFGIPDMYCLDRGVQIVEEQGKWYKEHGDLPAPVRVVADDVERDIKTGQALLRGLDLKVDDTTFSTDAAPFGSAEGSQDCPTFTSEEVEAAVKEMMQTFPEPDNFQSLREELFKIAGEGKAGDWTQAKCAVMADAESRWWAPLVGGCSVANSFAERLLMESAGGQTIGWGSVKAEDVSKYLSLHQWYLKVGLFAPELQKRKAASIAWTILETLEAHEPGTKVFAGHDTNQGGLSAVLGLSWHPEPWPHNSTMPGSALRFDREGDSDTVTVSYVFVNDFTAGGEMKSVPATMTGFSQGKLSLKQMRALVEQQTDSKCRAKKKMSEAAQLMAAPAGYGVLV